MDNFFPRAPERGAILLSMLAKEDAEAIAQYLAQNPSRWRAHYFELRRSTKRTPALLSFLRRIPDRLLLPYTTAAFYLFRNALAKPFSLLDFTSVIGRFFGVPVEYILDYFKELVPAFLEQNAAEGHAEEARAYIRAGRWADLQKLEDDVKTSNIVLTAIMGQVILDLPTGMFEPKDSGCVGPVPQYVLDKHRESGSYEGIDMDRYAADPSSLLDMVMQLIYSPYEEEGFFPALFAAIPSLLGGLAGGGGGAAASSGLSSMFSGGGGAAAGGGSGPMQLFMSLLGGNKGGQQQGQSAQGGTAGQYAYAQPTIANATGQSNSSLGAILQVLGPLLQQRAGGGSGGYGTGAFTSVPMNEDAIKVSNEIGYTKPAPVALLMHLLIPSLATGRIFAAP